MGSSKKISKRPKFAAGKDEGTLVPVVRTLMIDSRLLTVFLLQALCHCVLPEHDADAFKSVPLDPTKESGLDAVVEKLLGGFRRWDAVHFIHIAQYGFTFENNLGMATFSVLAFFPLYPVFIQLTTKVWYFIVPESILDPRSALLISGVGVNLICFTGAGYILFLLTQRMFGSLTVSYLTVVCYSLNPASIFFSSCYSESLYSFLSWLGLLCLYNGRRSGLRSRILEASVCFSLSLLTRANAYALLSALLSESVLGGKRILRGLLKTLALGLLAMGIVVLPFGYHQYGIYKQFCKPMVPFIPYSVQAVAAQKEYVLPGQLDKLEWCNKTLPLSYSSIQSKYWEVGFLGYFQLRKLPCFLLALPGLVVSCAACLRFLAALKPSRTSWLDIVKDERSLFPFSVHLMVMCVFGVCFINVEVITRMIFSASPVLYWYAAFLLKESMGHVEIPLEAMTSLRLWTALSTVWKSCQAWHAKLLILYFVLYTVIGTCLHSVFLPWT